MKRRVAILGSTGSIGTQALDVITANTGVFDVAGLAAGRNVALLHEQAQRFPDALVSSAADGPEGLMRVAARSGADIVLAATDGAVAFDAVFAAVDRGIDIAVANKELIVAAGELLIERARASGSTVVPVDSEHSAIFQCLVGEDPSNVDRLVLTASGGPFRTLSAAQIERATVAEALAHPTWRMGEKNSIDSATLMNKGLEMIEASRLFGIAGDRIDVVIHPQSIAHGFVIFADGSVKGQLCAPDMRIPIGYALAYPSRLSRPVAKADALVALGANPRDSELRYEFGRPDVDRFPCLGLAYAALEAGGCIPAVLSAANEVAVRAFLDGKIGFGAIFSIVRDAMNRVPQEGLSLDAVRRADRKAREVAAEAVGDYQFC